MISPNEYFSPRVAAGSREWRKSCNIAYMGRCFGVNPIENLAGIIARDRHKSAQRPATQGGRLPVSYRDLQRPPALHLSA